MTGTFFISLRNDKVHLAGDQNGQRPVRDLLLGLLMGAVAFCVFLLFPYASMESAVMLATFNLLYVFFVFPLRGKLMKKAFMLIAGNGIGFAWNSALLVAASSMAEVLGDVFNTFYLMLSPFLNLIWIVSYWSLSLTFLSEPSGKKAR